MKIVLILEETLRENNLNIVKDVPTMHVNFIITVITLCEKKM